MSHLRKLRLDMQDLRVESFEPRARVADRGTVVGHNLTQQINCYTYYYGCDYSNETCYGSCPATGCGCEPVPETQEPTCLGATCHWVGGLPYYEGQC